jgi:enamine deaminase RidA (YjgF/YER057c/UK114 family)
MKVNTNTYWEKVAGFSRAVEVNNTIYISGTTATNQDGQAVGATPAEQTEYIIKKFVNILAKLDSKLEDIVRTRIYVRNLSDWEEVAKVHGKYFAAIQPANTLVQSGLVGDEYFVEIEAEAIRR